MKCILMNKNTEILKAELDTNNNFTKIYEVYNISLAPLSIYNSYHNKAQSELKSLNAWYKGRGIPSWRKDVENLLKKLQVKSCEELLNKAYSLSLSDQYWLKEEENIDLTWKSINFFTNDFEYKGYLQASLGSSSNIKNISLASPNNTTDGMLTKAWVIENEKRVLVKSTYTFSRQEPINEWLASRIGSLLNLDYVEYKIDVLEGKLVSICENFLTEDEEIISASDIFNSEKKSNNENDFEHYIKILNKKGILDARKRMQDMYLVDYIMMNTDRHMKNYGIIRNVETGTWLKTTPIFDTGQSLNCDKYISELNFKNENCKFFYSETTTFEDLLKYINLSNYDIEKLKSIIPELKEKLLKYQNIIEMSDVRIEKLIKGFESRINHLQKLKEEIS